MAVPPSSAESSLLSKTRMLLILGTLLVLGFVVTSTVSYLVSRDSIRNTILRDDLPLTSDNIYSEIQRDLFEPILISSLMANDTLMKDWMSGGEKDVEQLTKYLREIQVKYHTISSFLVSEATRKYYHAEGILKTVEESHPADEWYFRVRHLDQPYEINVDPDAANQNAMTIFINYRVLDSDGKYLGATGVGLTVNAVKALMQDYHQRYGRDIYFFERDGDLLLHSFGGHPVGDRQPHDHAKSSEFQDFLKTIEVGKPSVVFSGSDARGALINFRYIPELDWVLVVEQTTDGTGKILFTTFAINLLICVVTGIVLLSIIHIAILRYQQRLEKRNAQLQEQNAQIEKQAAALAKANEKLDIMHREKDEFIGITAHDLKTPLNGVLGFCSMILEDESVQGETRECVGYIQLASHSMLEKVEALLHLTEVETPGELQFEELNGSELVRSVISSWQLQAAAKDISLVANVPEEPVSLPGNANWLVEIVGNLISNAIKYSPKGGRVEVSTRKCGDDFEITVQDQGAGIPKAEQAGLFQKFGRLSTRPTAGESSTGLGLYIVKIMITRMGGTVRCESDTGAGTVMILSLPLKRGPH